MTDNITYRKEAENQNLNSNKKQFLSILPTGSGYIFSFYFFLLALIVSMLFVIKLPVKIEGQGFFVSGYKQIPISFDKENYLIKKILVKKDEKLKFNQDMIIVSSANMPGNDIVIKKLKEDIHHQETIISKKINRISKINNSYEKIIAQDEIIFKEISIQLDNARTYESDEKTYYEKGLSTKKLWTLRKEATQSIKIKLEKSKQSHLKTIQDFEQKIESIENEINSLEHTLQEHNNRLDKYADTAIRSPCECIVGEIFTHENNLTQSNKVMSTLLLNKPGRIAHVYIPSDQYKPILDNSLVLIKPRAYPALKYGSISGSIISVSESTFSGKHYPELFESTANYFKVDVEVTNLPKSVTLQSGMSFNSEIVIQHLSLFQFIFE
jgi:hypothetical protein